MEEVAQSVKCDSHEFVSPSRLQSQHGDRRIPEACYGQPGELNWGSLGSVRDLVSENNMEGN